MKPMLEINGVVKSYPEGIIDLESLLVFIMENEISPEELIVEVKQNGKIYSEAYEHQARQVDLSKLQKLSIATQKKEVLANNFLQQVPDYIAHLKEGFGTAVELLRDPQQEEQGYNILAQSSEALVAFKTHLENVVCILGKDDASAGINEFWQRFDVLASEILAALDERNTLVVADLLESSMLHFLDEWQEQLG